MEPKNIIKARREELGLTEQQLADRVGVSRGSVQHWERKNGTAPSRKRQAQVAEALGISVAELIAGTSIQIVGLSDHPLNAEWGGNKTGEEIVIPEFDTSVGTGSNQQGGLILRDQPGVIRGWAVTKEWVDKNAKSCTSAKNLVIVTGFGDSMKPLFHPGDPILVDTGIGSVQFDGIYFFRVGQEGYIKRLQRIPGVGIIAISENKAYRDWTIDDKMEFDVLGRVVKAWSGDDY